MENQIKQKNNLLNLAKENIYHLYPKVVSIDVNMDINNWYNSPNQIEFSSYGMGIMMNMMMQMNIQMNGMTDVFSIDVTK